MRTEKILHVAVAGVMGWVGVALADVQRMVYWSFDESKGQSGVVTSLVQEAGAENLLAKRAIGAPAFSSEVIPTSTRQISCGNSGVVVNSENSGSLFFDGKSMVTAVGTFCPKAFTVEAFIKVYAHHDYPLIVGKVRDRVRNSATWSLSISGKKMRTRFDTYPKGADWPPANGGFNQSFSSGVDIEDGQWHHVAFSYADQMVKMYVDYLPCGGECKTAFPIVYTDGDLCIGNGAGEGPFNGWIDEVRMTPEVLEPDQFLYAMPFSDVIRNEWLIQRGPQTLPVAAAWDEWTRTDRIVRRQVAEDQPGAAERRVKLTALKQRLDEVTAKNAKSLFFGVRALKRECLLGDVQVDFNSVLCIDNPTVEGSEAYHEVRHRTENCATYGGRLVILDGLVPDAPVRVLAPQDGTPAAFWRPDLSFDATRVLYCMKLTNEPAYHLYETEVNGSATRQITRGQYNDLDPIYTADDSIVFSTSRCNQFLRCGDSKFRMFILARCDKDGKKIYFISANNEADFTPTALPDGRILYTRWEYVDREVNRVQSLWTVNPDGTAATAYWGNQSYWPDMQLNARSIPGSTRVLLHAPGHHAIYDGPLAVIDSTEGMNYPDGIYNLTPHIPWAEVGRGPKDKPYNTDFTAPKCYQAFQTPFPLGKDLFLVSARTGESPSLSRDANPSVFKLYLMDYDGNMELLYTGQHNILHAQPVRPRQRPPILPSTVKWQGKMIRADQTPEDAVLYSANVYEGTSIPRGRVKALRVMEIGSVTYTDCAGWRSSMRESSPYREVGAVPMRSWQLPGSPAISFLYDEGVKRVLGTVPVEDDGSVYFRIPAVRSVYFQLLDTQGRCLQTMRSFTHSMPGEYRGCVGCHETRASVSPSTTPTLAMKRGASILEPPPWQDETISFPRFVQPVLDKNCISCHGGQAPKSGLDLTHRTEEGRTVSWPYVLLVFGKKPTDLADSVKKTIASPLFPYYTYPNSEWQVVSQDTVVPPMTALSYQSKLIRIATGGKHHGVRVSPLEEARLVAWVDALCPYLGMEELLERPDIPQEVYFKVGMYQGLSYAARMATAPVVHKAFCQDGFESQASRLPRDKAGQILPSIYFEGTRLHYRIPFF